MKIYVGHRLEEGGEVYVEKDGKTSIILKTSEKISTDSLGFPLTVEISFRELNPRGRHVAYEDEHGSVADVPHRIELREGLNGDELAEVIAHEAYHLFYSVRSRITVDEETEAEVFGHLVKRLHMAAK